MATLNVEGWLGQVKACAQAGSSTVMTFSSV
jgi:hypothetical protein